MVKQKSGRRHSAGHSRSERSSARPTPSHDYPSGISDYLRKLVRHFLGANTVDVDRGCGTDRKRPLIRHVDAKDTHGENSVKTSRTTQDEDVTGIGR